ncbi:MAG: iron-containing alcohol dehydrogenase [Muribaculaceae bacterium]|nr:iron-containing alcohol dehydrogenase [Muribaculaceae bacterium]
MDNFTYCSPTRYLFGRDTEQQTGAQLAAIGCKKVLLVSGHSSARRSGLLDRVEASLRDAGVEWVELSGIDPNPTDDRVYEGIELGHREVIDGILAVGGGSVIDTAKAIAAGIPYDGDFWDFFTGKPVEYALPIGVVLTIPAAGSEGSGNAVITKKDGLRKISIRTDYWLRPKFAILNPQLTETLPHNQIVAGIADMMAHIMERYFSPTTDCATTDRISEGLLKAIIEDAHRAAAPTFDYQARANIMWAGTLAHNGICGCGRVEDWASHGLEHEISAVYGVTHGAGLAVVFPAWLTYVSQTKPEKVAQFARRVFDVRDHDDRAAAAEGISALKAFFSSLGLPITFGELGITDPDIPQLVKRVHINKGEVFGGYFRLTQSDTFEVYKLML